MFRRANVLVAVLGLLSVLGIPAVASAQFLVRPHLFVTPPARFFGNPVVVNPVTGGFAGAFNLGAVPRPAGFGNGLALGALNNGIAARGLYTNSYLNNAVGNVFANNAQIAGNLYTNALLTNALTGTPNNANVTALGNAYVTNAVRAQGFYTNSYLNNAVGNAFAYNGLTNASVYSALTPNYALYRFNNVYNPYNGLAGTYAAYTSPYGTAFNYNIARSNPYNFNYPVNYYPTYGNYYANYNPLNYGYTNPYAYFNPYAYANPYGGVPYYNPYTYFTPASYFNPNTFYNPYLYSPGFYTNPYTAYSGAVATPTYSSIYTPY